MPTMAMQSTGHATGRRAICIHGQKGLGLPLKSWSISQPRQIRRVTAGGLRDFFGRLSGQQSAADQHAEDSSDSEHSPDFVPISADSEGLAGSNEAFGPLAVLMTGFLQEETERFRKALQDIDGDMIKIICCSRSLLTGTLKDAFELTPPPVYEQPALGTQRAVIMSGMYGSEVPEVIAAYREAGLPDPIWAAALPVNWDRPVDQLLQDLSKDHTLMMGREQELDAQRLHMEKSFGTPSAQ